MKSHILITLLLFVALSITSFAQAQTGNQRILKFPKDKKVAHLSFCRKDKQLPRELKLISASSMPAVGSISVRKDDLIALEVTFQGADDLSWLEQLKPDDVQVLDLHKLPVSKAGYRHIARMTGLKYLFLEDSELADDDLELIGKLTNLIDLRINKTAVKGAGLHYLCPLQKLQRLDLGHLALDEKTLPSLQCLLSLRDLDLCHCNLHDGAIKAVAGIKSLDTLSLRSNQNLTDKCLPQLCNLKNLCVLNLGETYVTNNVGKQLKRLPKLGILRLGSVRSTTLDAKVISKELPGCRLIFKKGRDEFAKEIFAPLH